MEPRIVNCPLCHADMVARHRHGVELDLCPHCRGIWLDRGELDRIIQRSSQCEELAVERPPTRRTRDERQGRCTDDFRWWF